MRSLQEVKWSGDLRQRDKIVLEETSNSLSYRNLSFSIRTTEEQRETLVMHSSKRGSGERETSSSWVTTARSASCIARGSRVCHSAPAPPGPTPFPRTANSPEVEGNCTGNELGLQPVPVPELVVVVEAAAEFVD